MDDPLRFVWERADDRRPLFTADETARWPGSALGRLCGLGLLRPSANATSVVCDACGDGHIEEVLLVESPPGSPTRAYIRCPEAGRASVPLERLRQWETDFRRLAEVVASSLAASGKVEEIVPSRVWLLGKATLAGRPREAFLVRGLGWPDGAAAVGRATRLLASPQPLVLAPGCVPPSDVWRGDAPVVCPLAAVLSWRGAELEIDREHVEAALYPGRKRATPAPSLSFPSPHGAAWEDVRITMSERRLAVDVRGRKGERTFAQAGFEDKRRRGIPDRLWALLRVFALCGGVVPVNSPELPDNIRASLKQSVSKLGARLTALFHIDGKPFNGSRKSRRYEARFRIATEAGLTFPTPDGASWDAVSIRELKPGVIHVSVDAAEDLAVYSPSDGGGHWEGAQQAGERERQYDLRALSLAGEDGTPNAAGAALLAVLRASGKVRRGRDDPAMLTLCKDLSRLMQIDASPFQFSPSGSIWSALFDASSLVGDAPR